MWTDGARDGEVQTDKLRQKTDDAVPAPEAGADAADAADGAGAEADAPKDKGKGKAAAPAEDDKEEDYEDVEDDSEDELIVRGPRRRKQVDYSSVS